MNLTEILLDVIKTPQIPKLYLLQRTNDTQTNREAKMDTCHQRLMLAIGLCQGDGPDHGHLDGGFEIKLGEEDGIVAELGGDFGIQ